MIVPRKARSLIMFFFLKFYLLTTFILLCHLQYIRQDIVLDVFTYFPRQRGGPAEILSHSPTQMHEIVVFIVSFCTFNHRSAPIESVAMSNKGFR